MLSMYKKYIKIFTLIVIKFTFEVGNLLFYVNKVQTTLTP